MEVAAALSVGHLRSSISECHRAVFKRSVVMIEIGMAWGGLGREALKWDGMAYDETAWDRVGWHRIL